MVERYLIRKSLIKPMHDYIELQKLKKSDTKKYQEMLLLFGSKDHVKMALAEQLTSQNGVTAQKSTCTDDYLDGLNMNSSAVPEQQVKTVIKEVCCCPPIDDATPGQAESSSVQGCQRRKNKDTV